MLIDLKLSPQDLEIPIPSHFPENLDRDKLVDGYVQLRLGSSGKQWLEEQSRELDAPLIELSLSEALETIMRNERGRQGIVRGVLLRDLKSRSSGISSGVGVPLLDDKDSDGKSSSSSDPSTAILSLQRVFRGHAARSYVTSKRDEELSFIGMRRRPSTDRHIEELLKEASLDRTRRKAVQKERESDYLRSVDDVRSSLIEEEGPEIRDEMIAERRKWIYDHVMEGNPPPQNLDEFNREREAKLKSDASSKDDGQTSSSNDKKSKKGGKKDKKKKDDKKKDGGKKKGKKKS